MADGKAYIYNIDHTRQLRMGVYVSDMYALHNQVWNLRILALHDNVITNIPGIPGMPPVAIASVKAQHPTQEKVHNKQVAAQELAAIHAV